MQESFPFYIYSGLLTKEHRKRIGSALWEFLWCIDKTTREVEENGDILGLVLGGKPINLSEIANDLGGNKSTISRNLEKLENHGYLIVVRAPYGLIIKVKNSKKWSKKTVAKTQQDTEKGSNIVAKTQSPLQKRNERCKNADSNKDKAIDKPNDLVAAVVNRPLQKRNDNEGVPSTRDAVPVSELDADSNQQKISLSEYKEQVVNKYLMRRGRGLDLSPDDELSLQEVIDERIPLTTVLEGIDKAFDDYNPKHTRDFIRSLKYCIPIIFDLNHYKQKEKEAMRNEGSRRTVERAGYSSTEKASGEFEKGYFASQGIAKRL